MSTARPCEAWRPGDEEGASSRVGSNRIRVAKFVGGDVDGYELGSFMATAFDDRVGAWFVLKRLRLVRAALRQRAAFSA